MLFSSKKAKPKTPLGLAALTYRLAGLAAI
jgi:hypothetical protein